MAKIWTSEHEEFIREHYRHKTYAELADHFGVTQKAMESKIRRMGLKKQDYKEADVVPTILPLQPAEPESPPAPTGPEPIQTLGALPRRIAAPTETASQRAERLEAECEAAGMHSTARESERQDKNFARAVKAFEAAVKTFHGGGYGKAREAFLTLAESLPACSTLAAKSRQFAQACARNVQPTSYSPNEPEEFYLHGVMLLNAGRPDEALADLAKAMIASPGDDRILYCQAAAYAQAGDIPAAIGALGAAIDTNDANRIYAMNDPDFTPLHVHEDFRELVEG